MEGQFEQVIREKLAAVLEAPPSALMLIDMKNITSLVACLCGLFMPISSAQDAAPEDRNAINTKAHPGGMNGDSPVQFPKGAVMPPMFEPDIQEESYPVEKDYYLFKSPCRSLEQIRKIQHAMPAGTFTAPVADWTHLVRTRRALTDGGPLHIMAIGDSIVNDTMRSAWVALLQEAFPKAQIRTTVYVRGGGGCHHYKEEGRIENVVIPMKPDLVIMGGISQKDVANFEVVIRQLRKGLPNVEILLSTGAYGTTDPRDADKLSKAPHSGTGKYGSDLKKIADKEQTAYLDLTSPWVEYLKSSKLHPHLFYRDPVHANEYGEQILAKIMMAFFTSQN